MENFEENYVSTPEEGNAQAEDMRATVCKILVIGVGGAGNNAVNRMVASGIKSAQFIVANTDKQDLYKAVEGCRKLSLGPNSTKGLGAGSNPIVGKKAAEESADVIKGILQGVDLLFITAGMGGGTGTGAAPVIASIAHDLGILTIAVVTTPFRFEGNKRMSQAEAGISELRQYVDTLLVVPNEKLVEVMPKGTKFTEAFRYADDVLRQGIQGIADLIVNPCMINLDFADVRTVLKEKGFAHIGIGVAEGENRTVDAVRAAVNNKLLETNVGEATAAILNITGGDDLGLDEVQEAGSTVRGVLNADATLIFGADVKSEVGNKVIITIIATGFKQVSRTPRQSISYAGRPPISSMGGSPLPKEPLSGERPPIGAPLGGRYQDDDQRDRIRISDSDLPPFMKKLKK